jgi:ABC-type multidrug transport system fused ATPase/permease subunit
MSRQIDTFAAVIRDALQMLDLRAKRRFQLFVVGRVSLAILDLVSVALLSLMLLGGLTHDANEVSRAPKLLGLNSNQTTFVLFLAVVALSLFRAFSGLRLQKSILRLLAAQEVRIGSKVVADLFSGDIALLRRLETPSISYALTHGVNAAITRLLCNFAVIVSELVTVLLLLIFGLVTNFWGTLYALVLVLIVYKFLFKRAASQQFQLGARYSEAMIQQTAVLREMIESIRELRSMAALDFVKDDLRAVRTRASEYSSELNYVVLLPRTVLEAGVLLIAVMIGASELLQGTSGQPLEAVGLFMAIGFRIAPAVLSLQNAVGGLKQASGESTTLREVIRASVPDHKHNETTVSRSSSQMPSSHGVGISLSGVSFSYQSLETPVLRDLSLTVLPGERVAIVGESGSGKSTLVDLLLGLIPLSSGQATLDGQEPREFFAHNRGQVSYVPQQPALLRGSILSNITFGATCLSQADYERVWAVLESVNLSEFVKGLPNGLNSTVGESGSTLSGGQRQRIGIARALYRNPRLLILDEPTSALDSATEEIVTRSLFQADRRCTYLIVAHRLSTVQSADRVLKLEDGLLYDVSGTTDN